MIKNFEIPEEYICNVQIVCEYDLIKNRDNPSHDDIVQILKGWDKSVSFSSKDHDEFTKLRNLLEEQGYIKTERSWWNGDRVLKPFSVNGWRFKKHHKFPCAAALKNSIDCAKKFGWKNISSL